MKLIISAAKNNKPILLLCNQLMLYSQGFAHSNMSTSVDNFYSMFYLFKDANLFSYLASLLIVLVLLLQGWHQSGSRSCALRNFWKLFCFLELAKDNAALCPPKSSKTPVSYSWMMLLLLKTMNGSKRPVKPI